MDKSFKGSLMTIGWLYFQYADIRSLAIVAYTSDWQPSNLANKKVQKVTDAN